MKIYNYIQIVISIAGVAFFWQGQYSYAFACVVVLLLSPRINEIKKLTSQYVSVDFADYAEKFSKIKEKNKTPEEVKEATQKLIDEVFKQGWLMGGGKPNNDIWDVHIIKDEKGNITRVEYSTN